ncbi:hypothetical protein [Gemmatimonas sp.]|uniref:hypothetical protein n=1 Tax=Gemmatimonas sp. TaxID=1962908 RepID=UPI0027BAAE5F|nr:hypothetical protein [Gemmatimonas sp.]
MRVSSAFAVFLTIAACAGPTAHAQPAAPRAGAGKSKAGAPATASGLTGSYAGTATVPLGDSTIVVPVSYVFTGTAPAITGTAMVPGQGSGTISQVARDGARVRFRVTAGEGKLLEHDGTVAANGSIEGFVNLDGKPVAKFKIAPAALPAKPAAPAAAKPRGGQ